MPVGGSTGVGALGYVNAFFELQQQIEQLDIQIDAVVVASSSGGTHAGLQLGARLSGFDGQLLGISIDQVKTGSDNFLPILASIANDAAQLLEVDETFGENDFNLNVDYLGAGYAIMGESEREAIHLMSSLEAIMLGPVYTGRAFGGLIDLIRKGQFNPEQTVVFWHTGGTPEVFAYNRDLL
jgi:D-cysteine desulfhydrase